MATPKSLPAPSRNLTASALRSSASAVASTDIIVASGDYTGGASEDLFTLSSHGLATGDRLYCIAVAAQGALTGGPGTQCYVKKVDANTFHLCSDFNAATTIENTADGNVILLKGNGVSQRMADEVRRNIIVALHDFTGGTVEDMSVPYSGDIGDIAEADTIKLLYKSAAGVASVAADATAYVKSPIAAATAFYFQQAATAGGAVADTTSDGTEVWIKTS